jgi:hypothetical protein
MGITFYLLRVSSNGLKDLDRDLEALKMVQRCGQSTAAQTSGQLQKLNLWPETVIWP